MALPAHSNVSSLLRLSLLAALIAVVSLHTACTNPRAAQAPPPPPPFEFISEWGAPGDQPGQFRHPVGIAVDSLGLVYIADASSTLIQKFDAHGRPLFAFQDPLLKSASAIAIDLGGAIYVTDSAANQCFVFFPDGTRLRIFRGAASLRLDKPAALAVDDLGQIYIAESGAHRIQKLTTLGRPLLHWGKKGPAPGEFDSPLGIAAAPDGNIYVSDSGNRRIQKFDRNGASLAAWPVAPADNAASPITPASIAVSARFVFVTEPAASTSSPSTAATSTPKASPPASHPPSHTPSSALPSPPPIFSMRSTPLATSSLSASTSPDARLLSLVAYEKIPPLRTSSVLETVLMPLLLKESDVASLLTMPVALDAVEQAFRHLASGEASLHPRQRFRLPGNVFLNHMAAADTTTGYSGLKIYTSAPGGVRFLVLLYRNKTGELLAILEADTLGQLRTGAASGVATKFLARADARTVGIIGAGPQARTQLEAVCATRRIERIRCFSRNAERRAAFAREMSERLRIPVEAAPSAEAAVRGADIVITITTSPTPVVLGEWLSPGAHINAAGGNMPQKRELDDAAVRRADFIAADSVEQSLLEAGDLIQTFGPDPANWSAVKELSHVVSGKIPGRTRPDQITLFKSNGIAVEDIAAAGRVYEAALERKIGAHLPLFDHLP